MQIDQTLLVEVIANVSSTRKLQEISIAPADSGKIIPQYDTRIRMLLERLVFKIGAHVIASLMILRMLIGTEVNTILRLHAKIVQDTSLVISSPQLILAIGSCPEL